MKSVRHQFYAGSISSPHSPSIGNMTNLEQLVYEWEQSLTDVTLFIRPPPGVRAKHIDCKITTEHFQIGLKGNPPFLNEDFTCPVKSGESVWTLVEDGVIEVTLPKLTPGVTWRAAFKRHAGNNEGEVEEDKKRIMLERFQRENPGFDFSQATFNGAVPDASSFLGGVH